MASIGDAKPKFFRVVLFCPQVAFMLTVSQRARGEVKSDSKEHAMSESDYKGTAAGTVLGGKHGTSGKKYGHAWTLKASSVTKIENQ